MTGSQFNYLITENAEQPVEISAKRRNIVSDNYLSRSRGTFQAIATHSFQRESNSHCSGTNIELLAVDKPGCYPKKIKIIKYAERENLKGRVPFAKKDMADKTGLRATAAVIES